MSTRDSEQSGQSESLLDLIRRLAEFRICIGNRWKCDNGHEWTSAHGGVWLQMPTTCPECGKKAIAHMGEWKSFKDYGFDSSRHGRKS